MRNGAGAPWGKLGYRGENGNQPKHKVKTEISLGSQRSQQGGSLQGSQQQPGNGGGSQMLD